MLELCTLIARKGTNTNLQASTTYASEGELLYTTDRKELHVADASNNKIPVTRFKVYTVATLPASPTQGDRASVNDATAPTYLGALTGGGAVFTPVVYNGSAWVSY
jgi:hypothetical protein